MEARDTEDTGRYRIIAFGFPRSGTRYFSKVLQAMGLDVWHEEVGPDGGVSFHLVQSNLPQVRDAKGRSFWCPPLRDVDIVIYLYRDMEKTIRSCIANWSEMPHEFFEKLSSGLFFDLSKKQDNMYFWMIGCYLEYTRLAMKKLKEAKRAGCKVYTISVEEVTWLGDLYGIPNNDHHRLELNGKIEKKWR